MSDLAIAEIGKLKPPVLELGQFWRYGGQTLCFKPDCDTCKYLSTCQKSPVKVKVGPGLNIRRAFIARPGYKIVAIDYRGIELRVAALLSREPIWLRAFQQGLDLHMEMAKIAFKTSNPTKEQRGKAKCANFGNLYLGSSFTLARQSNLSEAEAAYVWEQWWAAVPTYRLWTDKQLDRAESFGYIETFFGRRRYVDSLITEYQTLFNNGKSRDARSKQGFVHRTSVNSPVQGSSADLMKIAMCHVQKWVDSNGMRDRVRMQLTVHDELVFEIYDDEYFVQTCEIVGSLMCPTIPNWDVPIEVDIEYGDNWADLRDLEDLKKDLGMVGSPTVDASGSQQAQGEAKSDVNREGVVLFLEVPLTERYAYQLQAILLDAHNVPETVKVPVRIAHKGLEGKPDPEKVSVRVHEPTLRKRLRDFENIEVFTLQEYRQLLT